MLFYSHSCFIWINKIKRLKIFSFTFFCFLGPHLQHMEVLRRGWIGVAAVSLHHSHSNRGWELHLQPTPPAHGNAGSLTHWARSSIEAAFSWILAGFITTEPQRKLQMAKSLKIQFQIPVLIPASYENSESPYWGVPIRTPFYVQNGVKNIKIE